MVRFKIGFTIDGETMFRMLSQFLPISDLHVEELPPAPTVAQHVALAKLVTKPPPLPLNKPKRKREPTRPMSLDTGINRVIMELLADGKSHRAIEFKPLVKAAGFSENSVVSRLQFLRSHGIIKQHSDSSWTANVAKALSV